MYGKSNGIKGVEQMSKNIPGRCPDCGSFLKMQLKPGEKFVYCLVCWNNCGWIGEYAVVRDAYLHLFAANARIVELEAQVQSAREAICYIEDSCRATKGNIKLLRSALTLTEPASHPNDSTASPVQEPASEG